MLAAEDALDFARATYREAFGYSQALDRLRGEVTDETREIRKAVRALLLAAEHDVARLDVAVHELAAYARSLGHPRPVVIDDPPSMQRKVWPATPPWLPREVGMGLYP